MCLLVSDEREYRFLRCLHAPMSSLWLLLLLPIYWLNWWHWSIHGSWMTARSRRAKMSYLYLKCVTCTPRLNLVGSLSLLTRTACKFLNRSIQLGVKVHNFSLSTGKTFMRTWPNKYDKIYDGCCFDYSFDYSCYSNIFSVICFFLTSNLN